MQRPLRIALCGKNAIAIEIAQLLRAEDASQALLTCSVEQGAQFNRVFGDFPAYCAQNAIECVVQHAQMPAADVFAAIDRFLPDIILSIQFPLIFPASFIAKYPASILNLHYGPLPRYRGVAPISQAIMRGDTVFGVTLHLIDAGIDTGPVLGQRLYAIEGMTNLEVYKRAGSEGLELFRLAWKRIMQCLGEGESLTTICQPQDDAHATYYSRKEFDYRDNVIPALKTATQIMQFIRAHTFPPCNMPRLHIGDDIYQVISARVTEERCTHIKAGTVQLEKSGHARLATLDRWMALEISAV